MNLLEGLNAWYTLLDVLFMGLLNELCSMCIARCTMAEVLWR